MKPFLITMKFLGAVLVLTALAVLVSCSKDEDDGPQPTGTSTTYALTAIGGSGVSGTATFELLDNEATRVTIELTGTADGDSHPTHIHFNSAAESGGIAVDLSNVEGATGSSVTELTELKDGSPVSYEELIAFDGYINVHNSAEDLSTLVAQGDIGVNALTGESVTYELSAVSEAISGTATFAERVSGATLVTITLQGADASSDYPTHIHENSAEEGGGIAISLNNTAGGMSKTHVEAFDDGEAVSYDALLAYDGYINVHNADNLGILIVQGNIGGSVLTGESTTYELNAVSDETISGTAVFAQRASGATLVTISLQGTDAESDYPTHIHENSAEEGGGIAISLSNVANGMSKTQVEEDDDGNSVSYEDLIAYDGYINVHNADNLSILMAQGNIGVNLLTGESETYELTGIADANVSGTAVFQERVSGATLVTIELEGADPAGDHPTHIHMNSAEEGGGIAIDLTNVVAGMSKTHIEEFNDGTPVTYAELIEYDGYINVHQAGDMLSVLVVQGNIGSNAGAMQEAVTYTVTNSGATAYVFSGNGLSDSSNPELTLQRGMTYEFVVNAPGHPFLIKSVQGTGTSNTYTSGITNSGATNGTVTFTVPGDAPDQLFYNCEFHASMTGVLTITN